MSETKDVLTTSPSALAATLLRCRAAELLKQADGRDKERANYEEAAALARDAAKSLRHEAEALMSVAVDLQPATPTQ